LEGPHSGAVGFASAIHAYDVSAALTYVTDGDILPHYQE
jgi:hypothetical protein